MRRLLRGRVRERETREEPGKEKENREWQEVSWGAARRRETRKIWRNKEEVRAEYSQVWALWISHSLMIVGFCFTCVQYYHVFFSFSLDVHLKINLDMVWVVPPTMKPIDFSMKWVSTYWVFCLFVCLFFFIILCLGSFIFVFGTQSMSLFLGHIFGVWMPDLCFGILEERGSRFN